MFRHSFVALAFALLSPIVFGEPSATPISSPLAPTFEAQLKELPPDARIAFLLDQQRAIENTDVDLARQLLDRARALVRTPTEGLQVDQRELGFLLQRGDYRTAADLAAAALQRARELGEQRIAFQLLGSIGRVQGLLGDYSASLAAYQTGLELSRQIQGLETDAVSYLGQIAGIYRRQGHQDEAIRAYAEALAQARQVSEARPLAVILANYALVLTEVGRLDEARSMQQEALAQFRRSGDRLNTAATILNLAEIDRFAGNFDAAIPAYYEALEVYTELDSKGRATTARLILAETYLEKGDADAAFAELEHAKPLIEATGNLNHQARYERFLSICLAARQELSAAVAAAYRYTATRNQIVDEKIQRDLADLRIENELARKNTALAELARDRANADAELSRTQSLLFRNTALFVTAATVLLAMAIAVTLHFRTRRLADHRILTATQQARREAEQANELKTRLLAIASHDLKSPLRGIESTAARFEDSPEVTPPLQTAARLIRHQAHRMFGLISEFLDYSALEAGRFELDPRPTSIVPRLQAALDRHRAGAEDRKVTLTFEAAPASLDPVVELDVPRFDQVLDNLLDNACRFSPDGGTVRLRLIADMTTCRVEVIDQGPGFSPEDYARVFQPFQTLSAQPASGGSGTGLGLHIAHEIVQQHGGRLGIDSVPGAGATLFVELPRRAV